MIQPYKICWMRRGTFAEPVSPGFSVAWPFAGHCDLHQPDIRSPRIGKQYCGVDDVHGLSVVK